MSPGRRTRESSASFAAGNQVRVLDDAAPGTIESEPGGRSAMAMAAFGAVMVLALWLTSASSSTGAEASDAGPADLAGTTAAAETLQMPDVAGFSVAEARAALLAQGLSEREIALTTTYRASRRTPAGQVLTQVPMPGATLQLPLRVALVVSDGGPVADFADLPADVRAFAQSLPGFDPAAPLLAMPTPRGVAWKNDDWLFGDCAAVELAAATALDPAYLDDCLVREATSITGTLIDGTRYQVWGLPPDDFAAPAPSGVIVLDDGEVVRTLGITTYAALAPGSPGEVAIIGNALVVTAGPWQSTVSVYPGVAAGLGPGWEAVVAGSVHPRDEQGHLVVGLDPPFRWQRPGESPSRIAADYGPFRVVAGCVRQVKNVVCDPSGAISIEVVDSAVDVARLAIRVDAPGVAAETMVDPVIGVSWELPKAWEAASRRLTSSTFPREVVSAGTYPLRSGSRCGHIPQNALQDLGAEDVFVSVYVGGDVGIRRWPRPLDWSYLDTTADDLHACAGRPELRAGIGSFQLNEVPMTVLVAMGDAVPAEVEREAWRLLDSVTVNPVMWTS